jgi:(p)ppGpp synthase/HD superfamily hydrolase
MTLLTDRFIRAVDYARIAHAAQVRKGSTVPYLSHPLGVASLVIDFGGTEDQAIAALLHDVVEDCGAGHEPIIRAQFGKTVADIVLACTDGTAEGKSAHIDPEAQRRDWIKRKRTYLKHLAKAKKGALLVSACDKLHNARAIVLDLENPAVGRAVFDRFKTGRDGTLGYYQALVEILFKRKCPVAPSLDAVIGKMHKLAGVAKRKSGYFSDSARV